MSCAVAMLGASFIAGLASSEFLASSLLLVSNYVHCKLCLGNLGSFHLLQWMSTV